MQMISKSLLTMLNVATKFSRRLQRKKVPINSEFSFCVLKGSKGNFSITVHYEKMLCD